MNSDVMRGLRQDLLQGKETLTCQSCRHEDQHNKISGRQRQLLKSIITLKEFDKTFCASPHWDWFEYSHNNEGYTTCTPVDFQIDLGNTCNSSCIMCIPTYSSKVATDYKKLQVIEPNLFNMPDLKSNWADDPSLMNKFVSELVTIPNIRYLHFLGGETLYLQSFYSICQELINSDLAKDISIGTTTNCTVYSEKLENILIEFKHAHLGLSVECFHPLNDYIRWPGKINDIEENIKRFINLRNQMDLHLSLRITPSALSVYHIDTIFEFMINNDIIAESCNLLTSPSWLRLELLPKDILNDIVEKIDQVINKYNLTDPDADLVNRRNETVRTEVISKVIFEYRNAIRSLQPPADVEQERYNLVKFLKAFEQLRNNKILDYLPEYEEFLRSYGY